MRLHKRHQVYQKKLLASLESLTLALFSQSSLPQLLQVCSLFTWIHKIGGLAHQSDVNDFFEKIFTALEEAPTDGVYIFNHGAMATDEDRDCDGALYEEVRRIVGPQVPIVATVDLHANISSRMVESVDVIVPYYTNPHVDQSERGQEAARLLQLMLTQDEPKLVLSKNFIRLPLIMPSVCLLTTGTGPFARWMAYAHKEKGTDVPVVGLIPGFAWSDTEKNGFAILTYGNSRVDIENRAASLARSLATMIWSERHHVNVKLTSLKDAVQLARNAVPGTNPICLADVADNPGGGGSGKVTDILRALLDAAVQKVLMGNFHLPTLAQKCVELGVGASFSFTFDVESSSPLVEHVRVIGISNDGRVVGRRGLISGRTVYLGPSAAITVGDGITMVVTSKRAQALDPVYFEAFGLCVRDFGTVVLKSRGHFRAGFDEFFEDSQIFEVDSSGLTSPLLERFNFSHLPRPSFPLDKDTTWSGGN